MNYSELETDIIAWLDTEKRICQEFGIEKSDWQAHAEEALRWSFDMKYAQRHSWAVKWMKHCGLKTDGKEKKMKTIVTFEAVNDLPVPDDVSKEQLQAGMKMMWQLTLTRCCPLKEEITVLKVEVEEAE